MKTFDLEQPGSADLQAEVLREIINGNAEWGTLLDLCCGEMTVMRHFLATRESGSFKETIHVDVADCPLRPADAPFIQMDVIKFMKAARIYSVAFCGDGLEHFTRKRGGELLKLMQKRARLSVIFTPLGDYLVEPQSKNPDAHKSGWLPADLPGWETMVFPNWHPTLDLGAFFAWKVSPEAQLSGS